MLARTLLVASRAFGERLSAERVASVVARGLQDGGWPTDRCPIDDPQQGDGPPQGDDPPQGDGPPGARPGSAAVRQQLDALHFDARMRASHALIVCEGSLHKHTLAGSFAFEIATRARQSGVPAYAVTAHNRLDRFDARILDLQAIVEGGDARSLRAAGRRLADLI